ncbi:hypothetical protein F4604DRAFT_1916009 [Suillus subluteus]|nr:hypothetical protein F4604DRAFT_1916009 [Suillus subluteus]
MCYGCGEKGHSLPFCPPLTKLIGEGKIIRTQNGRVVRPDGRFIRRLPEESVVEALKREEQVPVSHFIRINEETGKQRSKSAYIEEYISTETETESEEGTYNSATDNDSNEEYFAFPVEQTTRNSNRVRQEHFDNVFPPSESKRNGIERENKRENAPKRNVAQPHTKSKESASSNQKDPSSKRKGEPPVKNNDNNEQVDRSKIGRGWDSEDIIMDEDTIEDKKDLVKRK